MAACESSVKNAHLPENSRIVKKCEHKNKIKKNQGLQLHSVFFSFVCMERQAWRLRKHPEREDLC